MFGKEAIGKKFKLNEWGTIRAVAKDFHFNSLRSEIEPIVLFIEDHGERIYRYDRLLTQLKNSGFLDTVNGIVFGPMDPDASETNPTFLWPMVQDLF